MYRPLSAALAALLLAGCADQPTAPAAPLPDAPAPARVLGMVEVTFEAAGTPQMSASAHWLGSAAGGVAGGGGLSFDLAPIGAGGSSGIQLASAGRGFVDVGSTRYLYATFQVRNAATNGTAYTVARKNVTFVAYTGASTFAQTAVNSLARFDGTGFSDTAQRDQIAREILPTHGVTSTGAAPKVVSELADFQALPESDLTALPTTNGHPLAYGYVVRCTASCPDARTLPASPAAGEYDGRVTFAVKMPLQATATDNPFRFSMLFLAVEDGTTRVTEGLEEQGTGSVLARAAALPGSTIEILGTGSVAAGGYAVERLCRVRTAGTDPANPLATLVDAGGCTPGAVAIPTNVRVVSAAAAPGGDGTSWATAFDKLQDALTCVRGGGSCAGVTEIWVRKGVYYPDEGAAGTVVDNDVSSTFALIPGVSLYGGFAGTELSREQRDPVANLTILSGDLTQNDVNDDDDFVAQRYSDLRVTGGQSGHVVTADGTAVPITRSTVLDGFTLTGGMALLSNDGGGGLKCIAGAAGAECSPTLSHLVFSGHDSNYGGAVQLDVSAGGTAAPLFADVTFSGNRGRSTGGALTGGVSGGTLTPDFVRVQWADNTATSGYGGAIYLGGPSGTCRVRMEGARFERNQALNINGGGAAYLNRCASSFTDVVFWKNTTTGSNGGAVLVQGATSQATFTNVTFAGNSAPSGIGGAVYDQVDGPNAPIFTNVIVWADSAATSPGLHLGGESTILNSIIQGACPAATCTGVLSSDPRFMDLLNGDLRLQSNSPAVDAGDTASLPSDLLDLDSDGNTSETLPVDASLLPRVVDALGGGAKVDMGAYERQ